MKMLRLFALLHACTILLALVLVPPHVPTEAIQYLDAEAPEPSILAPSLDNSPSSINTPHEFELRAPIYVVEEVANDIFPPLTSTLASVLTSINPGSQPEIAHTEQTATGGLIIPRADPTTLTTSQPIIDTTLIIPQFDFTEVEADGTTTQSFPNSDHTQHIHGQTLPPLMPLIVSPRPVPGEFAPSTTTGLPSVISMITTLTNLPLTIVTDNGSWSPVVHSMTSMTMDPSMHHSYNSSMNMTTSIQTVTLPGASVAPTTTTHNSTGFKMARSALEDGECGVMWTAIVISAALVFIL